jgi:ribosomal protein S18 acetylase RimI-like enzyme
MPKRSHRVAGSSETGGRAAVRIRAAHEADCAALSAIARAAKAHWGYPDDWLAEWAPQLTITPRSLGEMELVLAEIGAEIGAEIASETGTGADRRICGFYGVLVKPPRASLEHLWVAPRHMRRGVGKTLYEHLLERLRQCGVELLEIESDPFAEPFYLAMGAVRVGQVQRPVRERPRALPLLHHRLGA